MACVANEVAVCGNDAPACPKGTSCIGGKCLSDCDGDAGGCPGGQSCASDMVCRGGEDAGTPGNDADASVDRSEPADAPAGDVPTGDAPRECTTENAIRCDANAVAARSICQGGKWTPTDPCADGSLCDTSATFPTGTCKKVDPLCFGRKPGDSFCNGATRVVCGPDLVTSTAMQCPSAQHCSAVATGCAACLDNEFKCDAMQLSKCKADHSGFDPLKMCAVDAPCNAQAGDCTTHACSPMQKRCNGDKLEQCNADQSGFVLLEQCGAGLCDNSALVCDKCVARSVSCANGSTVRSCSADGQTQTDTACPSGMPFCTGAGVCVACRDATNCTAGNDCTVPTCNAGTCGYPPKGMVACNGGICDGSGNCVECLSPVQCTAKGECFTATCGTDHKCSYTQKGMGVTCSAGYCNAAGTCVACLNSGQCTGTKPICSAQSTCVACATDPQCNAKGVGLNYCHTANGACVACNVSTQCPTATTPICDPASLACRACTANPSPTGDSECNARNGATAPACKSNGSCVKCTSTNTTQCTGAMGSCDVNTNMCVACVTSASCSGTTPICSASTCTACTTNAQCVAKGIVGINACKTSTGACVQCTVNADCGGTDVCTGSNTCCTPEPLSTTCAGGITCGNQFNNCGVQVSCGLCGGGTTCCEDVAHPGGMICLANCN
jgi:hypothetical protein